MGANSILTTEKSIIFFDSNCLLCSRFVRFTLQNDKRTIQNDKYTLHFAGLNSRFAKEFLPAELIENPETVVFAERGDLYLKSEAIFKIIGHLGYPWRLLKIFHGLPVSWNDHLYDWVAKNRSKWFGRSDQCYLPEAKYQSRFFD